MAVDVCSEISSPRISFSHDLNDLDTVPVESDSSLLDPTIDFDFDFDFCIGRALPQEISPADELFADGKILPVQIKEISITPPEPETRIPDPAPKTDGANKKRLIEFLSVSVDEDEEDREKPLPKPFWQFRRSSSDNSRANGLLRSLQFLTRSNSTGSVPNRKSPAPAFPKGMQKQHSLKETCSINRQSSYSSSSINYPYCHYNSSNNTNNNLSKKPSLRKSSSSRSYGIGNGVRISPVLNIPPSYITKGTVSLFGFGSFFCSKKSKKKRK